MSFFVGGYVGSCSGPAADCAAGGAVGAGAGSCSKSACTVQGSVASCPAGGTCAKGGPAAATKLDSTPTEKETD